jgi:hypothetical protein
LLLLSLLEGLFDLTRLLVGVASDDGDDDGIVKQGTPSVSEISRQRAIQVHVIFTMLKA